MYDRFSDSGRTLMGAAREEAQRLKHDTIGPEHLLLAITDKPEDKAARLLQAFDVDLSKLHHELESEVGEGTASPDTTMIPFTPSAKRVLENTLDEAKRLGHSNIRSEHLLLGLLREEHGHVAKAFGSANVSLEAIRARVGGRFG